jgi:hypothetical protein
MRVRARTITANNLPLTALLPGLRLLSFSHERITSLAESNGQLSDLAESQIGVLDHLRACMDDDINRN